MEIAYIKGIGNTDHSCDVSHNSLPRTTVADYSFQQ
jgi:hypothetical protein